MKKSIIYNFIKQKLATDKKWQIKALLAIYQRQTIEERNSNSTIIHNDVGFSGCDAEILSSFAKQWLSKWFLSPKQAAILAHKMPKYWKQIYDISDKEKLMKIINTDATITITPSVTIPAIIQKQQISIWDEGEE